MDSEKIDKECLLLRKAEYADAQRLYTWAMSPEVRNNAIHRNPFSFEVHCRWLEGRLLDHHCKFYILEYQGQPIGQVRMDYEQNAWLIDYSIDPRWRGKGAGKRVIELAIQRVKGEKMIAKVWRENIASCRIFEKNGFLLIGTEQINGRAFNIYQSKQQG